MSTISQAEEKRIMSKVTWKIVPYIFFLYIIAMIDRVNVGFAALTMNKDLGINASTYGLIAGIFFIAYFFFEVPSNVIMHKVGARKWIARILISWGFVVIAEGFVNNAFQLGALRTLLGVAEAGFYPCMILYLTYWFPGKYQARAVSFFMVGMALANVIGGPLTAMLMDNVKWLGMAGWRWAFIMEGIPAVIFGIVTFFILVDRPQDAKFLDKNEKKWLIGELDREMAEKQKKIQVHTSHWAVLKNPRVWHMGFSYLCYCIGVYGVGLWMPQMIKGLSKVLTTTQVGLISAIPYIAAAIVMVLVARHSDAKNERRLHVALPISIAFFALIGVTMTSNLVLSMVLLTIALSAIYSFVGVFWTIPNLTLSAANAAVGIALINSFGNLGGFFGPYVVGWLKDLTGSTTAGMYFLATMCLLGTVSILIIPKKMVTPPSIKNVQTMAAAK